MNYTETYEELWAFLGMAILAALPISFVWYAIGAKMRKRKLQLLRVLRDANKDQLEKLRIAMGKPGSRPQVDSKLLSQALTFPALVESAYNQRDTHRMRQLQKEMETCWLEICLQTHLRPPLSEENP